MSKQEENLLYLLLQAARRAWWSRPGYEPIGHALDVFDALGFETRSGQKPRLAHKHRTPSGWRLSFHLPAGISSGDVLAKLQYFEEQVGGRISVSSRGATLHMDISTAELPRRVTLVWERPEGMDLPIPIGLGATGPVVIDLARLPHLFVAGTTGGGKTTALRAISVALLQQPGVFVTVIDLKGLDFLYLRDHGLVVDTERDASAVLAALNREMDRRRQILKRAGATKLQEYKGGDLPWIVCIIDELAELQDKDDQDALNRLGRLARAVGISLITATQRPSHTLFKKFTDLRMLFSGRLVFSVPKPEDSRLILDSDSASKLPPDIPGRAIWRWNQEQEVQCYDISQSDAERVLAQVPTMGREEVWWYEPSATRLLPR